MGCWHARGSVCQGLGHWTLGGHRLRGRNTHLNREVRHSFLILALLGPLHPEEASFETRNFLDICLNLPFRWNATEGAAYAHCLGGFQRKEAGDGGEIKARERGTDPAEFNLNGVSITPNDTNQPLRGSCKKQLSYLSPLLCFLNLFSAQPNELSELSDSSKEWQMSMLCGGGCYFARNTWCM